MSIFYQNSDAVLRFRQQFRKDMSLPQDWDLANPATRAVFWTLETAAEIDHFTDEELETYIGNGYVSAHDIRRALQQLRSIGALEEFKKDDDVQSLDSRGVSNLCIAQLRSVSLLSYLLLHDVSGLSGCEELKQQPHTTELFAKLRQIADELHGIRAQLKPIRERYVTEQLADLKIDPSSKNLKLHFGAGRYRLPGWVNIDVSSELSMNLLWGVPFANESTEVVYLSHVLEHFYVGEALSILRQAHRLMAPGGWIRVVVPDAESLFQAYLRRSEPVFNKFRKLMFWIFPRRENRTPFELLSTYIGMNVRPADFSVHKFGFDQETMVQLFKEVGFVEIRNSRYLDTQNPELHEAEKISNSVHDDMFEGYRPLYIEARKGA